jgi:esterase/lipase
MWDAMSKAARQELAANGIYYEPNPYGDEPTPITKLLIDDGEQHLFGDRLIEVGCPVHILQGMRDAEVPWRDANALVERLASDDVVLTLVKDGDHRLSRPEDIERLRAAISGLLDQIRA